MKTLLKLLLLGVFCAACSAEETTLPPEARAFKGIPFETTSMEQFLRRYPNVRPENSPPIIIAQPRYLSIGLKSDRKDTLASVAAEIWFNFSADEATVRAIGKTGYKQPLTTLSVDIREAMAKAKFTGYSADFRKGDYDVIVAAFTSRYGEPHKKEIQTKQNRMGASFDSARVQWKFESLEISIEEIGSKIDEGSIIVSTQPARDTAIDKGASDI